MRKKSFAEISLLVQFFFLPRRNGQNSFNWYLTDPGQCLKQIQVNEKIKRSKKNLSIRIGRLVTKNFRFYSRPPSDMGTKINAYSKMSKVLLTDQICCSFPWHRASLKVIRPRPWQRGYLPVSWVMLGLSPIRLKLVGNYRHLIKDKWTLNNQWAS